MVGVGAVLVLMFVFAAIFAPVIAPYGPLDQNLSLLKAGGIVVNIAIVAYLAWMLRRRLPREAAHA